MFNEPLSYRVKERLLSAARTLRTADPSSFVGGMIEDSFAYPGVNALRA